MLFSAIQELGAGVTVPGFPLASHWAQEQDFYISLY